MNRPNFQPSRQPSGYLYVIGEQEPEASRDELSMEKYGKWCRDHNFAVESKRRHWKHFCEDQGVALVPPEYQRAERRRWLEALAKIAQMPGFTPVRNSVASENHIRDSKPVVIANHKSGIQVSIVPWDRYDVILVDLDDDHLRLLDKLYYSGSPPSAFLEDAKRLGFADLDELKSFGVSVGNDVGLVCQGLKHALDGHNLPYYGWDGETKITRIRPDSDPAKTAEDYQQRFMGAAAAPAEDVHSTMSPSQ